MTTLKDIRERWAKATPGPWNDSLGSIWVAEQIGDDQQEQIPIIDCLRPHDNVFVANAPTDIAYLLELVERAKQAMGHLFVPEYEAEAKHHMKQLLQDMESAKGGE